MHPFRPTIPQIRIIGYVGRNGCIALYSRNQRGDQYLFEEQDTANNTSGTSAFKSTDIIHKN